MLVLSRNLNEKIDINGGFENGGITICICELRGDKVRLGFDCPKDVVIDRSEITERKKVERNEASAKRAANQAAKS